MKISQEIRLKIEESVKASLYPPPKRLLWEWAEENVTLSPKTGTFSPGKYRTRHTPHCREVMEAFQDADIREISLVWGAQSGKTQTETVCVAWCIDNDPANTLFVMPSEQMARSYSATRLQEVILASEKVNRHRILGLGKFNKLEMEFDNMVIALAGAGSASNLASRPIKNLIADEIDKYPPSLGDEGSPLALAEERTKTFPNRKVMKSSTVTTEQGEIWSAYMNSDQREWMCPCPKCGEYFLPSWKTMEFPKEGTDDERASQCFMVCPSCGYKIGEGQRRQFVSAGKWVATAPMQGGRAGFRISELQSRIGRPWPDLVRMFLKASRLAKNGNHEALRAFTCSVLAEPWRVATDTLRNADKFMEYCGGYNRGSVPDYMDISGLTMGIDTQDNGFWWVIRAWGGGEAMESWLVDWGFAPSLEELERVAYSVYMGESGREYRIKGGFMDSQGHRTQEVYGFCKTNGRVARIIPTKGERTLAGGSQLSYSNVDRDAKGKVVIGGLQLCRVNTTLFKDWLDAKLRIPQADLGAFHIPDDADEEYCRMMTSEFRDENGIWQLRGSQFPNHLWDCEVLALARAFSLRLDKGTGAKLRQQIEGRTYRRRRLFS